MTSLRKVITESVTEYAFPGVLSIEQCDALGGQITKGLTAKLTIQTPAQWLALPTGVLVRDQIGYGYASGPYIERLSSHWLMTFNDPRVLAPQLPAYVVDYPAYWAGQP